MISVLKLIDCSRRIRGLLEPRAGARGIVIKKSCPPGSVVI